MNKTIRTRTLGLLSVGVVSLFALTAPAANAVTMPKVMNGEALSQAMTVTVNIPSAKDLKAALVAAGAPVSAVPDVDQGQLHQAFVISSTTGLLHKDPKGIWALGEVAPLGGFQVEAGKFKTSCYEARCDSRSKLGERLTIPSNLGTVDVAGVDSASLTHLSTNQGVGLVDVDLSLEPLLGDAQTLSAVGDALDQVVASINSSVLPPVNAAIDNVKTAVDGIAVLQPLKKELDRVITVDRVKPLPALSTSDLVTGTVLGGQSVIQDKDVNGTKGVHAVAQTNVTDLKILNGWVSIDSIAVSAEAFSNSVKGANYGIAESKMDVLNASLGGLLGVHVSADDLIRLTTAETLKGVARDTLKTAGVDEAITDLENAVDILYNTAGIRIEKIANEAFPAKGGDSFGGIAYAFANSMRVVIEPKIPMFNKLTATGGPGSGTVVPALAESDYVPTGIYISIDLPSAQARVEANNVRSFCFGTCIPVTGIGSEWFLAFALLGAAIVVKRYALSR